MYCRYCGKSIPDDSDFCTYCGKTVGNITNNENILTYATKSNSKTSSNSSCTEHLPLIVRALAYIALGTFLIFNIKMAPFYSWWKFLAYVVEGAIVICLTVLAKNKISNSPSLGIKILSVLFSIFIILACITLRIVYENKVDTAEKDIPASGTILVDVHQNTDYYSYTYMGGLVYDTSTSVKINGSSSETAKIVLGQPTNLEVEVEGNHDSGSSSGMFTLSASNFVNGKHIITKTVQLGNGISATVEVTLRRYCTFWDVILY